MKNLSKKIFAALSAVAFCALMPSQAHAQITVVPENDNFSLKLIGRTNMDFGSYLDKQDDESEIERIPPEVLTAMIAKLPSGCRMILNLYVFEHCSHKEIATKLGIKENTSSSQLSRARQLLAKMMTDYIKRHET